MNKQEKAAENGNTIILYGRRIEDLLAKNGASGNGAKEKVQSIFNKLQPSTRKNIAAMSELRNKAAHTEFVYCTEREMANFEANYKAASHALIMMLETKQQNAEAINNLKVTMAAKTGYKKWLIGIPLALLVVGGVALKVKN